MDTSLRITPALVTGAGGAASVGSDSSSRTSGSRGGGSFGSTETNSRGAMSYTDRLSDYFSSRGPSAALRAAEVAGATETTGGEQLIDDILNGSLPMSSVGKFVANGADPDSYYYAEENPRNTKVGSNSLQLQNGRVTGSREGSINSPISGVNNVVNTTNKLFEHIWGATDKATEKDIIDAVIDEVPIPSAVKDTVKDVVDKVVTTPKLPVSVKYPSSPKPTSTVKPTSKPTSTDNKLNQSTSSSAEQQKPSVKPSGDAKQNQHFGSSSRRRKRKQYYFDWED